MTPLIHTYPVVVFGEILWDILPSGAVPGGACMNVAYHLRRLGADPLLITRVGLDDEGKRLIRLMEAHDISTDYFQVDFELPTGKVHAIAAGNNEYTYDIIKPVAWDNISWDRSFESLLSAAGYFVFGSLSTRSQVSRDTLFRLLEMAKYKVLDINLRAPHYTRRILERLLKGVDLLKLNQEELELLTGWFISYKSEEDRIYALQDRFNIPKIVVTKGANGAVFNVEGKIFMDPGFHVHVVDTIGSGDAFLAALMTRLLQEKSPAEALKYACAVGALIASYRGPCPDYAVEEIDELTKTGTSS